MQIAHLAGLGSYDAATDAALGIFADAIVRRCADQEPLVRRRGRGATERSDDTLRHIAARIRQIGIERVLYGSDAAVSPDSYPRAAWATFRRLPLSEDEFRLIATNVAPYMRGSATPRRNPDMSRAVNHYS